MNLLFMKKLIILSMLVCILLSCNMGDMYKPGKPENFIAYQDGEKIKLEWSASSKDILNNMEYEIDYYIDRDVNSNYPWPYINTLNGETEFIDSNVSTGNTYYYRVYSVYSKSSDSLTYAYSEKSEIISVTF